MKKISIAFAIFGSAGIAVPAHANITGNVNSTITLTTACKINGTTVANGSTNANFGALDFGTQNSYFTQATAQLATGGNNGISIQCSNGTTPSISFSAGSSAGSGTSNTGTVGARSMKRTGTSDYVTYNLYSDSSYETAIVANTPISLATDGSAQTLNVYGVAYGANGLPTGNHSDVVVVTVSFGA